MSEWKEFDKESPQQFSYFWATDGRHITICNQQNYCLPTSYKWYMPIEKPPLPQILLHRCSHPLMFWECLELNTGELKLIIHDSPAPHYYLANFCPACGYKSKEQAFKDGDQERFTFNTIKKDQQ